MVTIEGEGLCLGGVGGGAIFQPVTSSAISIDVPHRWVESPVSGLFEGKQPLLKGFDGRPRPEEGQSHSVEGLHAEADDDRVTEAEGKGDEEGAIVDEDEVVVARPDDLPKVAEEVKVGDADGAREEGQGRAEYEEDHAVEHDLEEGRRAGRRSEALQDGQCVEADEGGDADVDDEGHLDERPEEAHLADGGNAQDEGLLQSDAFPAHREAVNEKAQHVVEDNGAREGGRGDDERHGEWVEEPGRHRGHP